MINLLKTNMIVDANFCSNSLNFRRSENFFEEIYRNHGHLFYAITLFKFHNDKPVFFFLIYAFCLQFLHM